MYFGSNIWRLGDNTRSILFYKRQSLSEVDAGVWALDTAKALRTSPSQGSAATPYVADLRCCASITCTVWTPDTTLPLVGVEQTDQPFVLFHGFCDSMPKRGV